LYVGVKLSKSFTKYLRKVRFKERERKKLKHIDPHVHCRDWNQAYKATIQSVVELARQQNVCAIFDMPNTNPPIVTKKLVEKRVQTAKEAKCLDSYFLYIGATKNSKQIREAATLVKNHPKVIGIKMFAGRSVGDLGILNEQDQVRVYKALSEANYDGVLAVHCEKEKFFTDLWDPENPWTWNLTRPPKAETESLKDQIKFAKEAKFTGILHICHVSVPKSVDIIHKENSINITCGVTPHHITYSIRDMIGSEGLKYKVNPPLRDHSFTKLLRDALRQGKIDWIETDHAPHTEKEKKQAPYLSGIQSLKNYSTFLTNLMNDGFSEAQISDLTFTNIKNTFRLDI
jgi:dihydroorotase